VSPVSTTNSRAIDDALKAAGIAAAAGVPRTMTVTTLDAFTSAFDETLAWNDLTTSVAKVDAVGPAGDVTELSLLENRFQFQRYLRS
jgi:sulfopyruvate decarboxylase subunit beta